VIFVDANVFMYAAGAEHRHKQPSVSFVEAVAGGRVDAAVDAEVLQEILHRYRSIRRWSEGRRVYDLVRQVVARVVPVRVEILDRARALLDEYVELTARDALHAAACLHHEARGLCSYDRDFDGIAGLRRLEPDELA